jgi:serine/threonine-protein kinase
MTDAAHVPIPPMVDQDADAARRMAGRAMRIGLWVWPAFAALDAYMCFVAYPGAPFLLFLAYRIAIEMAFLVVFRASRRRTTSVSRLFWGLNVCYGGAAVAIALMAVHLGGIRSPYMHGISIIALVRAALVPLPWRRSLPTFARIALAFPLVIGLGAIISPLAREDWLSADALTVFASNYVFVVASSFLGLVSGHIVWRTQQQLYRERRIGRYRLQAPIGKGGMGEVWLAWDLALHRNVALKLLRLGAASSAHAVQRFEREARAASRLRGPHVVQIYDFGASDDGLYYLAMEYLSGMDLASLVEKFGPVPPARAVYFMLQACRALEEAHAAGIIHRDIKPHNLFVTQHDGDPDFIKLLDFGIVRLVTPEPGVEHLTWTGFLVGTPAYLAPELWAGATADERSDIYALGVTLEFLLTGVDPSPGRSPPVRAPAASDGKLVEQEPLPAVQVPEPLRAVVLQCVAENPEARMPSARALREALEAVHDPATWTREDAEAFWRAADRVRFG